MFVPVETPTPVHSSTTTPVPPVRSRRWSRLTRGVVPYLYLTPALILLVVWTYRPLVQAVQLSTVSWNLLPASPMKSVGTDNYKQLFELPALGDAVWLTVVLIIGLLPFTVVVPVVIGFAMRGVSVRSSRIYQGFIFAPFLVAPVAGAAVWRWLLDPSGGTVNRVLGTDHNWIYDKNTAQLAIIVITGWHLIGFAVLAVAAGLAGISSDYDEAAQLDGATRLQIGRRITLPLLSPTLVFLTLMTILLSAQWSFPLIDTLTQGGPAGATTNIYYLLWDYGFHSFNAGLSAAAGIVLFLGFGVVAGFLVWLSERITFHDN
ncbi:MAG: glycerol-3-phosphate ABC transporter permease [Gordonia sp. (in: high G+C Gram-positive bacteria)]|nr:MAG: glycerol-3-phosphate ABC transporter permease [Gordonia sp. (in: high G+C Gram-positive bacteria)]